MSQPLAAVPENATLTEAFEALVARKISCVPVIDKAGRATGVLSRTDLLRIGRIEAKRAPRGALLVLPDRRIVDIIKAAPVTVLPNTPLAVAAKLLVDQHIHRVFVRDEGEPDHGPARLVAVLSTKEILAAIRDKRIDSPLSDWMVSPEIGRASCRERVSTLG